MYKGILHTHYLVVTLFLLIYVIKTILLLSNKNQLLLTFSKKVRLAEIIISVLFLASGIYLSFQLPFGGKFDYLFWIKIGMVLSAIPIAIIGFKKHNKVLAALSLLLITASYGLSESYSKKKGIAKESANLISSNNGKDLYNEKCSNCHGEDGKLGRAGAKDLSLCKLNNNEIQIIILNGKGLMPKAIVDSDQAKLIAEFVSSEIMH